MNPFTGAYIIFGFLAVVGLLIIVLDDNLRPWGKRRRQSKQGS